MNDTLPPPAAAPEIPAPACACFSPEAPRGVWWRIGAGAFLAANAMVLSLAVNGSEVTPSERVALEASTGLLTAAILLLLGGEFVRASLTELRARRLSLELLFLIGIVASLATSALSLLAGPTAGQAYFDVAGLLLVIYSLGREVGRYGQQRLLEGLSDALPAGEAALAAGDRVLVLPGRPIPVDGHIVSGEALVQEANLTGESFAVPRHPGDAVVAGAFPLDASLLVEAAAPASESHAARLRERMRAGILHPGRELLVTHRLLRWFVPVVALAALATGLTQGLSPALAVLVIACPCALGFASPLTVWAAMGRLRQIGILCRSGEALERLAAVDTVVFDKTGTLTAPEAYTASIRLEPAWQAYRPLLLSLLATAEEASGHPLARAMAPLWDSLVRRTPVTLDAIRILPARGIEARLRHGRTRHTLTATLSPDPVQHLIAIQVDNALAATVTLEESLRPAVAEAIDDLRSDQLQLLLTTGDRASRAELVPIDDRLAAQSPEDKLALVRELADRGRRVLFAGDGWNDGAAMAWSHLAITVPSASPAVQETAALLSLDGDWRALPVALRIARQAVHALRRNVFIAIAYNGVGIALAAAGVLTPVTSAILMTISSLTVILLALNVLNWEVSGEHALLD